MNNINIELNGWDESKLKELLTMLQGNSNVRVTLSCDDNRTANLMRSQAVRVSITQLLLQIGIPSNLTGYLYIREALDICMEDRSELESVTKKLYPKIAERFATSTTKVEHAIRHAIENAWKKNPSSIQETLFGYSVEKGTKPTNSAFIATVTDYLKLREETEISL